jgi:DNA polymerase-3 subunit alpha
MTAKYVAIKSGKEEASYLIPELEPILSDTHSCMIYQEQVMRIFKDIVGYNLTQCDDVRKAIGKKILSKLEGHCSDLVQAVTKLGYKESIGNELFEQIIAFAGYCLDYTQEILTNKGYKQIGDLVNRDNEIKLISYDPSAQEYVLNEIEDCWCSKEAEIFEVTFEDGSVILCTEDHLLLTIEKGYIEARDILKEGLTVVIL